MSYVIVKFRIKESAISTHRKARHGTDSLHAPGIPLAYTSDATSQMIGRAVFIRLSQATLAQCFLPDGAGFGRVFVVNTEHRHVGRISYDRLKDWRGVVVRLVRKHCLKGEQECSSKHFSF